MVGFDIGTFRKQAFLNDAINLGANFRDNMRGRAAWQFGRQEDFLWLDRHRSNFLGSGRWRLPAITATQQKAAYKSDQNHTQPE